MKAKVKQPNISLVNLNTKLKPKFKPKPEPETVSLPGPYFSFNLYDDGIDGGVFYDT